jgi:hypothetical protein
VHPGAVAGIIAGQPGRWIEMSERTRKICLIGDFGVGKTSLVSRFVNQVFSEKYLTTVGVKIDTKQLQTAAGDLKLVIWDLAGKNALDAVRMNYLKGASGLLIVADGTRESTVRSALFLLQQSRQVVPEAISLLLVNKFDLVAEWEVSAAALAELRRTLTVFQCSAKTGEGVEAAFQTLADRMP